MACWSSREDSEKGSQPKTVSVVMGYFFLVNYCIGTGFLGIPYSFFYSGYLAAIPTLLAMALSAWVTAKWLLEVMARAQVLETYARNNCKVNKDYVSLEHQRPIFEITIYRKFEIVELSQIFVGRWFKYTYLLLLTIYGYLGNWSFASVAGSTWATNIPYNFGNMTQCDDHAFHHDILPHGSCLSSYYFSLFLYGVIVTILSVMGLKEQAIVQAILGLARFVTIGAIVIYSLVKIAQGGDACLAENHQWNWTAYNISPDTFTMMNETNAARYFSYENFVVKFDPKGWITVIPVFLFAFMLHSSLSSLTHPVKQKKYLQWMVTAIFASALGSFMILGIVVPLWFKAKVQETITLNWVQLAQPGNPLALRILSYYLVFFPSMDAITAYALTTICIVNNIYMVLTGRDTSKKPKWKYDWLLRFFLRFFSALLPLGLAMAAANLVFILQWSGLFGFGICFLFPVVLQLRSIYVCKKKFGQVCFEYSPANSPTDPSTVQVKKRAEKSPLLNTSNKGDTRHLYMTPYSNAVVSHPIFVAFMGVVGFCLFVIGVVGLFIGPDELKCTFNSNNRTNVHYRGVPLYNNTFMDFTIY